MKWRWLLAWVAFFVLVSAWNALVVWFPLCELVKHPPGETIRDSGTIPLTISVRVSGNRPVRSVSAEAFGSRQDADEVCESTCPPETKLFSATQQPFAGDDLVVHVPTSTTTTRIGLQP